MFFFFLDPAEFPVFGNGVAKFETGLQLLRNVDPNMPIGVATTLVRLGREMPALAMGQKTLKGVASDLSIPYSTLLRHTDALAEGSKGVRALGLIEKGVHPEDRRARQVRLTAAGTGLLLDIDEAISKV
jgi:DNA-binding MarR family transcriptional regulator